MMNLGIQEIIDVAYPDGYEVGAQGDLSRLFAHLQRIRGTANPLNSFLGAAPHFKCAKLIQMDEGVDFDDVWTKGENSRVSANLTYLLYVTATQSPEFLLGLLKLAIREYGGISLGDAPLLAANGDYLAWTTSERRAVVAALRNKTKEIAARVEEVALLNMNYGGASEAAEVVEYINALTVERVSANTTAVKAANLEVLRTLESLQAMCAHLDAACRIATQEGTSP